jgi:hypothetical protein
MPLALARLIVGLLATYAALGLLFAPFFVLRGVDRIDPSARGASWGFRLLIVPGVVALWPYLALRWLRGAHAPPEEVNAHRVAARAPR